MHWKVVCNSFLFYFLPDYKQGMLSLKLIKLGSKNSLLFVPSLKRCMLCRNIFINSNGPQINMYYKNLNYTYQWIQLCISGTHLNLIMFKVCFYLKSSHPATCLTLLCKLEVKGVNIKFGNQGTQVLALCSVPAIDSSIIHFSALLHSLQLSFFMKMIFIQHPFQQQTQSAPEVFQILRTIKIMTESIMYWFRQYVPS